MDLKKHQKLLIIIPILFSIYINFWVLHNNYTYPVHADEWQHIAQAKQLIKNEFFSNENPYIENEKLIHLPSVGFHFTLAVLSLILNFDLVQLSVYLKIIFSTLMVLGAYLLGKQITKGEIGGILFSLAITLLKSDITILGPAFLVPIGFIMYLLPTFFYFFIKSFDSLSKYNWLVFFSAIFITSLHAPFIGFLLVLFSVYLLFVIFTKSKIGAINLISIAIPAFFGYLLFSPMFISDPTNIENLIFTLKFTEYNEGGDFLVIYDVIYLLGTFGVISLLVGTSFSLKNKFTNFLLPIFTIFLLLIILYSQFNYTYLMPYRRLLMYTSFFGLLIAGYGIHEIYLRLNKEKIIKSAFITLIVILTFIQIHGSVTRTTDVYRFYDESYASSFEYLKNLPENTKILATTPISTTITPMTGKKVCTLVPAQLSGGLNANDVNYAIETKNCELIKNLIITCNADIVLSNTLNCDFLKQKLDSNIDGSYIYEFEDKLK